MCELSQEDWELVNAYHDGELSRTEARAFERRLKAEPGLAEALMSVKRMSDSIGALRADIVKRRRAAIVAARSQRFSRFLLGGAAAAALLVAVLIAFGEALTPSIFDVHAQLTKHAAPGEGGPSVWKAGQLSLDQTPDLSGANLTLIAYRSFEAGGVAHYAGPNGCRLSYFHGVNAERSDLPKNMQLTTWSSGAEAPHMIVATGMDQEKFDAIANYLMILTLRKTTKSVLASLTNATATAAPCLG